MMFTEKVMIIHKLYVLVSFYKNFQQANYYSSKDRFLGRIKYSVDFGYRTLKIFQPQKRKRGFLYGTTIYSPSSVP